MPPPEQILKPCKLCEHHFSLGSSNFCRLHCVSFVNYVEGTVEAKPMLCRYAREEACCGKEARDYSHRGPEKEFTLWDYAKGVFSLLVG
jgi:hypothetical protein